MPTVEEDIQHLIRIVQKDMEIRDLRKLSDGVPRRVRAIDREIKPHGRGSRRGEQAHREARAGEEPYHEPHR